MGSKFSFDREAIEKYDKTYHVFHTSVEQYNLIRDIAYSLAKRTGLSKNTIWTIVNSIVVETQKRTKEFAYRAEDLIPPKKLLRPEEYFILLQMFLYQCSKIMARKESYLYCLMTSLKTTSLNMHIGLFMSHGQDYSNLFN